jgi:hypothetical protein
MNTGSGGQDARNLFLVLGWLERPRMKAMAAKSLKQKLGWKPGMRVLLTDLPVALPDPFAGEEYATAAAVGERFELLVGFARDRTDLRETARVLLGAALEDPKVKLWICYPKGSSKVKTDLTRDAGWEPMFDAGWLVVAIASVDAIWSAVRFRQRHLVQSTRCAGGGTAER